MWYIYDVEFGMLQVRENEMPLRKWSGGTAHLRGNTAHSHTQTGRVDLYDDTTMYNLLELEHHAGFTKLSRWIMKTRHSKYSFALSVHSEVRIKP